MWCHLRDAINPSYYRQYSSLKELHLICRNYTFVISALNVSNQRQKLGNSSENVQREISQRKIKHWLSELAAVCVSFICLFTQKRVVIEASYYQSLETKKNNYLCLIKPKEAASEKTAPGSSPCPAKFIRRLRSWQWCNMPLSSALTDLF